jgi:hypothetical protein
MFKNKVWTEIFLKARSNTKENKTTQVSKRGKKVNHTTL